MTIAIVQAADERLEVNLRPWPDLTDEGFFQLCAANPDLRLERTAERVIVIMPPAGSESGYRNGLALHPLLSWAARDGRGVVFDSSAGFSLPNGAVRAPDAAWVSRQRLAGLSHAQIEEFLPLCPDFVIEVRSRTDRPGELREKMAEYAANGAVLGWLIDPYERTVDVYRPGRPTEHLAAPVRVAGDPELPGLVLELGEIWRGLGGAL